MKPTDELREVDQIAVLVSVVHAHGQTPMIILIPPHLVEEALPNLWPSLDNRLELFGVRARLAPVKHPLLISFSA